MKKFSNIIWFLSAILFWGCEEIPELSETPAVGEDTEVTIRLNYGSGVDEVLVTKAGLNATQESAIYSLYIMTFNASGARTNNSTDALFYRTDEQTSDRIWVDESGTAKNYSKGYVQFNAKTDGITPSTIYALANVNNAALNGLYSLSSDDLDKVTNISQLQDLIVGINQEAVTRGSQMLMYGSYRDKAESINPLGVVIPVTSNSVVQLDGGKIFFHRLDAKITFNVSLTASNAEFELHSWQVFNVPKRAKLSSGKSLGDGYALGINDVFDTSASNQFDGSSFTFYMLESNLSPESPLDSYKQREAKVKNDDGSYALSNGKWTWAHSPEYSPYVQIKGRLSQSTGEGNNSELIHADVVYNIHLGDFSQSPNDFWVKPNTEYTYNVYVQGIDNIRTEVTTSETGSVTENQPGAEGNVVIASGGSIYEVDSHYAQILIPFTFDSTFSDIIQGDVTADMTAGEKAALIDALTWYVSTPYSEGTYQSGANDESTNHYDKQYLDYKWVEFYISTTNRMVTYTQYIDWLIGAGRASRNGNVLTKTKPLYIDEFVEELKAWYKYKSGVAPDAPKLINATQGEGAQTIYVTAFVNEFYYENGNPFTNDGDIPAMVRTVVNSEDRYMHILSDVDFSKDGASSVTQSAATIIQSPIRSIYNIPDFGKLDGYNLIWGTETVSEEYGSTNTYDHPALLYGNITSSQSNDVFNGRKNTYYLWGTGNQKWEDRMTIDINNTWTMVGANNAGNNPAVYACLARNRDENGDGTINVDEMKWYMAARNQLMYLQIGSGIIHGEAQLLPSTVTANHNYYHFLSSTYVSGGGYFLAAEEGLTIDTNNGSYRTGWDPQHSERVRQNNVYYVPRMVRCLRNLGADSNSANDIGKGMSTLTSSIDNESSKTILPTYLNPGALRKDKWIGQTEIHNDKSEINQMYIFGFEVDNDNHGTDKNGNQVDSNDQIKNVMQNGTSPCPEGWRIPVQKEIALILIEEDIKYGTGDRDFIWSATHSWYKSLNNDTNIIYSGITGASKIAFGEYANNSVIRCVRDIDQQQSASSYENGGSLIN